MARIRSTHPGQWADDDFLDLSPWAALLGLAVRNFADDQGVFEWKPTQLRRACLPQFDGSILPLLSELSAPKIDGPHAGMGRIIQPFLIDGRPFGAIRNFIKYQRPKSPRPVYFLPHALIEYIGFSGNTSEIKWLKVVKKGEIITGKSVPIPPQVPKSPLLIEHDFRNSSAEEGGRRKEEGGSSVAKATGATSAPKPPSQDDKTWLFNEGLQYLEEASQKPAAKLRALLGKWLKQVSDNPGQLRRVFEQAVTTDVADPVAWITKAIETRKNDPPTNGSMTDDDWERLRVRGFKEKGAWGLTEGPKPGERHCTVPRHILDEFGYDTSWLDRRAPESSGR